jgi:hypothetical protein
MAILSTCVIKLYYPENHCGMAVNYHSILTLEKSRVKSNVVIYRDIVFKAPGDKLTALARHQKSKKTYLNFFHKLDSFCKGKFTLQISEADFALS